METTNKHFEALIGDQSHGYERIDFNKRCNYIKDMFGNFIGFFNGNKDGDLLLSIINKDKIIKIDNMGSEEIINKENKIKIITNK